MIFEGREYLKFYTIVDWSARLLDSRGIVNCTQNIGLKKSNIRGGS